MACISGEICDAEVLLCQQQVDSSWSLPPSLIERTESYGLIVPVGYWAMEGTCRQLATWQSQGIMLPLSVNVSLLQLLEHDHGEEVLKLIAHYCIAPDTLTFEVMESCRVGDPRDAMARLRSLRKARVQIMLGDFGMGYVGLHQLQQMKALPMDILKIDKVFIDMPPKDVSMVSTMIQLARDLSLRIVAEGVENGVQYCWLQAVGVEMLQDYLFGYALPLEAPNTRYLPSVHEGENL